MEHTLHGGGTFVCPINCGPCNQCVGNMSKGEEVEQQLTESVQAINPNMTRPLPIYIQGCCVLVVRGLEQLFRHLSRPIKMIYWLFQWFWNLYKWWLTDWRTIRPSLTGQQRERETFCFFTSSPPPRRLHLQLGGWSRARFTCGTWGRPGEERRGANYLQRIDIDLFGKVLMQLTPRVVLMKTCHC